MGETSDPTFPTITYTYKGRNYAFNGAAINGYDGLFTYLSEMGMTATAVVLNDWNEAFPELIHPDARNQESGAYYYMFNAAEEEGTRTIEAVAGFLAERYSSGEHGMIHSWVIANEINQNRVWNYINPSLYYYHYFTTYNQKKSREIFLLFSDSNYENKGVSVSNSGGAIEDIRRLCPKATIEPHFYSSNSEVSSALNNLDKWIEESLKG